MSIIFLFLILVERFQPFTVSMVLAVGLSYIGLYYVEFFCWEFLSCKDVGFSQMLAFGICWDDHMVLVFILLMCHTYWFAYIKSSLHSMMNHTCSLCMILLMCCWIHFANVLLRISACIFIRDIDLYFSFLVMVLSGFGIRTGWPCKMSLGIFSPLQFFGRVCEGFTSEIIWAYLAFCLLGGYWFLTLISLIALSCFSMSSCFSHDRLHISMSVSIFLRLPTYWHLLFIVVS